MDKYGKKYDEQLDVRCFLTFVVVSCLFLRSGGPRGLATCSRELERRVLVVYVFRWGRVVVPGAVQSRCGRAAVEEALGVRVVVRDAREADDAGAGAWAEINR